MTSLQIQPPSQSPQDAEKAALPADKSRPRPKLVNRTQITCIKCGTVDVLDELRDYVTEWHEDARAGLVKLFFQPIAIHEDLATA